MKRLTPLRFLLVPFVAMACTRGTDAPPTSEPAVAPTLAQAVDAPEPAPTTTPAPVVSAAAIPPACPSANEPPAAPIPTGAKDASRPLDVGGGYLELAAAKDGLGESRFCGKVERIEVKGEEKRVVLSGTGPEAERSFDLRLPAKVPPPFGVGDDIVAHLRSRTIAIHRVLEGTILDGNGRLLIGFSHDGTIGYAPGWSIDVGAVESTGTPHMAGGARRQQRELLLARDGAVAKIRSGTWRQLTVGDSQWAVSGDAVEWTQGPRPPDASSYRQFSVVRLRTSSH